MTSFVIVADKLRVLADSAKYDASCASSGAVRRGTPHGLGNSDGMGICHSYTPDGTCVSLLKILLTNYCIYDCQYCVNRVSSDVARARFSPQEVVDLTLEFYKRNYIEGLFLSSGIIQSADYTTDQLVDVARVREGSTHLPSSPRVTAVTPGGTCCTVSCGGSFATVGTRSPVHRRRAGCDGSSCSAWPTGARDGPSRPCSRVSRGRCA